MGHFTERFYENCLCARFCAYVSVHASVPKPGSALALVLYACAYAFLAEGALPRFSQHHYFARFRNFLCLLARYGVLLHAEKVVPVLYGRF